LLIGKASALPIRKTREVVIDLDATNDLLHGSQQGRFFHGYYGNYRYLTLYAFIGEVPVRTELRTSQSDASKGSLCALRAIVPRFAGAARTPGSSCGGQRFLPRR
jgi:Transposase DDE domain group 1